MREAADGEGGLKTGTAVWDGALLLTDYLLSNTNADDFQGAKVLEIGAGTGLVGLILATAGADVCLTDGSSQVLRLLECNTAVNAERFAHPPRVRRLRWGCEEDLERLELGHVDFVIASECVYGESAAGAGAEALLATLEAVCQPGATQVLMSYTLRPVRLPGSCHYLCPVAVREVPFFANAARRGFQVQEVNLHTNKVSSSSPKLVRMVRHRLSEPPAPPAARVASRPWRARLFGSRAKN